MVLQDPESTDPMHASSELAHSISDSADRSRASDRWQVGNIPKFGRLFMASLVAVILLLAPVAKSGIWDPVELRVADMASRVAASLLHAKLPEAASSLPVTIPTLGEIGRGELPYTSIAVGFRLFGLHDWAGRLPLTMWIIIALIAIVAWVDSYIDRRAAIWTALVYPTIPIVFFQARFMLGDATTIGTLTACFVCLCFGCIRPPGCAFVPTTLRMLWLLLGAAASVLGIMSRGLLLATATPFLSVGLAGLLWDRREGVAAPEIRVEKSLAIGVLAIGLVAAVVGVWVCSSDIPQQGIGLILQGSSLQRNFRPFTFDSVVAQLGHGTFPWSGMLVFAIASTFARMQRRTSPFLKRSAIVALVMLVFLAAATHTWLGSFGVALPFPAIAALAAIVGIWLNSISKRGTNLRLVAVSSIAILIVLADISENLPDKILVATASSDAHIPLSFRKESAQWVQGGCAVIFGTLLAAGFDFGTRSRNILSQVAFRRVILRASALWRGQLGFYVLLIETALLTGAVLLLVTHLGLPFRRLKDLGSPQRELLSWSWLVLPLVTFAMIGGEMLLSAIDLFFSPGFGIPAIAKSHGSLGRVASRCLIRFPALRRFTLERGLVCAVSLLFVGIAFSLGWATRLGEQLSPRRALSRYEELAHPGEVLGLLGVRPQITQYYSKQRPQVLLDSDEAADWLLFGKGETRWMIVKGDQLPRLNAAYRERCQCFQNLPIVDGRSSDLLLASNHRFRGMPDENPLDEIILDYVPQPQQNLNADFGDQIEVLGWELVADDGVAIAELGVGRKYELRLFYRVIARPTIDWETFVHIDGFGRRYNGDHETTQGRYPMSNWRTGDLVVDKQTILLDPSFSHGNYELYFGFFKGSRRLEVRRGRHDDNRLFAGTLRVR